ncbi:MAG: hypothetical protein JXR39_01605 [Marinilabiliaceae bacterium]|nr:hypothetical protein [Marinilabiliaceae bacterium]
MKTTRMLRCALFASVLAAFSFVGCEEAGEYLIDSPSDMQHKIDSIAAVRASLSTGDTTNITINNTSVGADDNSSIFWTEFSDYFTIPANKLLHLEFVNYSSGAANFNNWNLAVVNEIADRDGEGYSEYFVLRSDAYGWGNSDFDKGLIAMDYPDTDGDGDVWNDFRTTMQGATVYIDVDHSVTGNVYVTAKAVGTNGVTLTETYQHPVSPSADINAFLIADGSHFVMKRAYLIPSKVAVIKDVMPVSITVAGAPSLVEIGNEDFWGSAIATVTFEDGSSEQVSYDDLSFTVIPDMTTVGKKTVVVAYGKSKLGEYAKAVSTYYSLDVTNSIVSISASNINYYYYSSDDVAFRPTGIVVTAKYSDGSTAVLDNSTLTFDYPSTVPSTVGTQSIGITYVGASNTFTTTSTVSFVNGIAQVGVSDLSTVWWSSFSDDYAVASGGSKTITMYCYSDNVNNWHSPCVILRKADKTENAVVRMDNHGWGDGFSTAIKTSDWNWDTFTPNISGSKIVITVTNNGDKTADVLYNVTYANGETHFQKYAGITVDSSDLYCALTLEKSYVVIVE